MPIQPGRTFQRMYTNRESLRRSSHSYLCAPARPRVMMTTLAGDPV